MAADARKRTAVLVVHGIGRQRTLDTVRGIIRAVWFDQDEPEKDSRRISMNPESSGADIDLAVMTTSRVSEKTDRSIDFHELYWAHLMRETKAVAVLLWLFELGRKGPRFKQGMNGLWWGAAIFLCLMLLSISLLGLKTFIWAVGLEHEPNAILTLLILQSLMGAVLAAVASLLMGKLRLAIWVAIVAALIVVLVGVTLGALQWFGLLEGWALTEKNARTLRVLSNILLPLIVAGLATKILMGWWGLCAFAIACAASLAFLCIYLGMLVSILAEGPSFGPRTFTELFARAVADGTTPWSLTSKLSVVDAWFILAVYLIVNARFLQSYLGDAARYLRDSAGNVEIRREIRRQAVEALDSLHRAGTYDRIIVVGHSLGSVVAYDMLRAYYSRIHGRLPDAKFFEPEFSEVNAASDNGAFDPELRHKGRAIIAKMLDAVSRSKQERAAQTGGEVADPATWLVTDFVTLGSPLTHAYYLMCPGSSVEEMRKAFGERTRHREYPVCPPQRLDRDGLLAPDNWLTGEFHFHRGGLFGMTRWTNIYFPMKQLFWGDAIGGALAPVFGPNILDVEVSIDESGKEDFFSHTAYWDVMRGAGRKAPHIVVLRKAIDLEDTGVANNSQNFSGIQGVHVPRN